MSATTSSSKGQGIARIHTNQSKRKTRDKVESKPALKNVLSNPFEIKWPLIAPNVQNAILARVSELLSGVAQFNTERQKISREKQKKGKRSNNNARKSRDCHSEEKPPAEEGDSLLGTVSESPETPPPPAILRNITIGINEVTKRLESQCQIPRLKIAESSIEPMEPDSGTSSRIEAVVVCKSDIDPPLLVAHLPHLVAACNSASRAPEKMVRLITLPKGSEVALSQAVGLRRAAVLGVDETIASDSILADLLTSVPLVMAPWLVAAPLHTQPTHSTEGSPPKRLRAGSSKNLIPTHIKQLRTTAPKDMRAAKELRARERAAAKANRKAQRKALRKRISTQSEVTAPQTPSVNTHSLL